MEKQTFTDKRPGRRLVGGEQAPKKETAPTPQPAPEPEPPKPLEKAE